MHMMLDKYNPRAYLPASVEHNPNKKLVSGQPYEEVLYYKDAAPYGPTYHLMTIVAELFWSAGRSNRFLTPMILAYLREDKKPEEFVPASSEQPMSSQRPEDIPIASPEQPVSSKRPRAKDNKRGLPSKKKNKLPSTERQSAKELSATIRWDISQATNDGLRGQLAAKDAAKSKVHALAQTEVQHELEEFKRSVTELEDFKRSVTAKEKAAEEAHLQKLALVQTELEETKRSSEASIKRLEEEASHLWEALAAKESVVQALENARHKEISTLKGNMSNVQDVIGWRNRD
ncbi:hypothetical protein R1flu_009138 [Riccia fluitans]|uniref:Uncharacterized protein n=1 Tax=Riccia fluitans TaxID=41844 RepID=A0ABD1Z1P5_9MARC